MEKELKVDVAIIGAGTAGLNAYREVKKANQSVVLIDPGPLGTTCARVGCMPSKLLIAAGEKAAHARNANELGVHISGLRIDSNQVLTRVRKLRDFFTSFGVQSVEEIETEGEFIRAKAKFLGPNTLSAGDHTIEAKSIVLAIGAKATIAEPFRDLKKSIITYEQIFELEDLPKKLLVVGTGVIGLELGLALHHLGVDVTFLARRKVIANLIHPELTELAYEYFKKEVKFHCGYSVESVEEKDGTAHIQFKDESNTHHDEIYDCVLIATGRRPDYSGLDLKKIGLDESEMKHLPFNRKTLRLKDTSVFVAGDVTQENTILHEAALEGRFAGINAANFPKSVDVKRPNPFSITFTDPQIALVGKTYAEISDSDKYVSSFVDYSRQGRARVMNENAGGVYLYAEKSSGLFVGAEMFCPRAEHMSHLLSWALELGLTIPQMTDLPFYHPVFEEGLRTALRELNQKLIEGE